MVEDLLRTSQQGCFAKLVSEVADRGLLETKGVRSLPSSYAVSRFLVGARLQILRTRSVLHRFGKAESDRCLLCDSNSPETLSHILFDCQHKSIQKVRTTLQNKHFRRIHERLRAAGFDKELLLAFFAVVDPFYTGPPPDRAIFRLFPALEAYAGLKKSHRWAVCLGLIPTHLTSAFAEFIKKGAQSPLQRVALTRAVLKELQSVSLSLIQTSFTLWKSRCSLSHLPMFSDNTALSRGAQTRDPVRQGGATDNNGPPPPAPTTSTTTTQDNDVPGAGQEFGPRRRPLPPPILPRRLVGSAARAQPTTHPLPGSASPEAT